MSKVLNHCDVGHTTGNEIRKLPTGGGGNILVCRSHFLVEMEFRKNMIAKGYTTWGRCEIPAWEQLEVYKEE